MNHKMSEDNVNVEINEIYPQKIDIKILETKPLVKVSEEKLTETFCISTQTLQFLQSLFKIISQRNSFKIEEFKIVGTFYETLLSVEGETVSGDFIQGLLNILQTLLKRGAFQLNELQIISELYSSISNVL